MEGVRTILKQTNVVIILILIVPFFISSILPEKYGTEFHIIYGGVALIYGIYLAIGDKQKGIKSNLGFLILIALFSVYLVIFGLVAY